MLLYGGVGFYNSFIEANLINKFHLFQAPILIGNDGIPMLKDLSIDTIDSAYQLDNIKIVKLGDNLHIEGYLNTGKLPMSEEK